MSESRRGIAMCSLMVATLVCGRRHSASAHHQFGGEHIGFEGLNAGSQLLEQSLGTDTAKLGDWLFNMDVEADKKKVAPAVLAMAKDPSAARAKAAQARALVEGYQRDTMAVLARQLG